MAKSSVSKKLNEVDVISTVTHQTLNPMSGVLGNLELIIQKVVTSKDTSQLIIAAKAQLEYVVSLIENMAYLGKLEDDDFGELHSKEVCSFAKELIDTQQFFIAKSTQTKTKISIVDPKRQICAQGSSKLLRQVFFNIMDNYMKYTLDGHSVSVTSELNSKGEGRILFSATTIPIEDCEAIFLYKMRGKHANEVTRDGSGIGLYLCKLIVEKAFQGKITAAHNRRSKITEFDIRIPNCHRAPDYER